MSEPTTPRQSYVWAAVIIVALISAIAVLTRCEMSGEWRRFYATSPTSTP